ncbi:hypothetical protein FA13DRAFT_1007808 [Coprinellus micaceus]|uniref:Uncharacterized protein n=1 Tax=Coprinellus micaceus TaxID=71717 RepID=A0A4Y7SZP9_COPMI|nr:hypothetical protein FA13DRAFT_1007808 [Coprinellus micaceus]
MEEATLFNTMEGGTLNQGGSNSSLREDYGADGGPANTFMPANHLSAGNLVMQNTGGDHIDMSSKTSNYYIYNKPSPDSGRRAQSSGLRIDTSPDTHLTSSKAENTPPEISLIDVFAAFSRLVSWIFKAQQLQESSHCDTSTPETPVRAIDVKDLPLSLKPALGTPTPAEIYVCDLMCSGHGLPCWDPRPRQDELQPAGIVPGDVGTYSVDDGFKKLFNLWDVEDIIRGIATTYCEGTYEPLGGTSKIKPELGAGTIIAPGADCRSPTPPLEGQGGVVHEFRFPSSAGGILAVLSAANIEITDDKEAMRTYITQYAEALYTHARGTRRAKPGESLYFVTGSIKNDLWARAAYQESRAHGPHHVRLLRLSRRTGSFSQNRPSSAYQWKEQPAATYPHHDDSGIEGPENPNTLPSRLQTGIFSSTCRSNGGGFSCVRLKVFGAGKPKVSGPD